VQRQPGQLHSKETSSCNTTRDGSHEPRACEVTGDAAASETGKEEQTTFSPLSTSDDELEVKKEGEGKSDIEETRAMSRDQSPSFENNVLRQENMEIANFIVRHVFRTVDSQVHAIEMTPPGSKEAVTRHDIWISPRSSGASMLSKEEASMMDSMEGSRNTSMDASIVHSRNASMDGHSRNASMDGRVPQLKLEPVQAKALADEIAELKRQRALEEEKLELCRRDHAIEREKLELCQAERARLEEKLNTCRDVVARTVAAVDALQCQRRALQEISTQYGDENCENMHSLDKAKANALEASSSANEALALLQTTESASPSKENSRLMNSNGKNTVPPRVRSILQDANGAQPLV
jgi:hypothetical protein